MKLIKQNGPFCLVASAAMILDTTIEELHQEIGHNGTEIWWPPNHMRGVHIQEIQDCCLRRQKCLYPVEREPLLAPDEVTEPQACPVRASRLSSYIVGLRAILITDNHAVAWDGNYVFDPKGMIKSFHDYTFREAWILGYIMISHF